MGERFWLHMYREAKEDALGWFKFAIGEGVIIAALVAALIMHLPN